MKYTDAEIIRGLTENKPLDHERIVSFLFKEYRRIVYSIVTRNGGLNHEVDDVLQEALTSFVRQIRENRFNTTKGNKPEQYFYGITRNIWLKRLRDKRSEPEILLSDYSDISEPETDVGMAEDDEKYEKLNQLFALLGQECRAILTAFYYENKSYKEITEELDLDNEYSAKTKKYRCMLKLKEILIKHRYGRE